MNAPDSGETLFLPGEGRRARASGLPPDVVAQSARRLRILALLYASVFFLSAFFPSLLNRAARADLFSSFTAWGPGAIAIAVALAVAVLSRSPPVPLRLIGYIGLGFQVASSFGIAAAEFLDPAVIDVNARWVGLSWVAIWALLFTVVVPSPPRRTVIATLASVSAVPLVIGYVIATSPVPGLSPTQFFFGLVFPYLLVTAMAYVGSRVIYGLGREVTRARELGGYRLVERLGAGGMGEVWRAEHHLLARPAAIKLVRQQLAATSDTIPDQQLQERFRREAEATASLRSPHTIELYDFGLASDGTFYYVMELLDGFDLDTLVEQFGPLPSERAINLLIQVCHSLGEAHAQGLIHRDIKPANVFTCRYGREVDFVKVLDFGMVKSRSEGARDGTQLTRTHAVWGTPAFISPEQVLGIRPLDARTDLYALGCLAYWLVTGRLVFKGRTAMETMMQHTHAEPVPPSQRSPLDIPPALDDVVLACLAKTPDDRPSSADALAEALAGIPTRSAWTARLAHEWWDRYRPAPAASREDRPGVPEDGTPRLGWSSSNARLHERGE
jgi:serine/threonine-protein kinase